MSNVGGGGGGGDESGDADRCANPAIGIIARACIAAVRGYQLTLSRIVGGHCRYHPTCSQYAIGSFRAHGAARGAWLTLRRLLRCHPWGGHGHDPVPPR